MLALGMIVTTLIVAKDVALAYLAALLISIGAPTLVLFWNTRSRAQEASVTSYELTLSADLVRRTMRDLPPMMVSRQEATRIYEHSEKGLTVATSDPEHFVFIPKSLEGYDEVREHLRDWRPIEPPQSQILPILRGVGITIVMFGSVPLGFAVSAMLRDWKWILVGTLPAMVAAGWLCRKVFRSSHVTAGQKRSFAVQLAPLLAAPLLILAFLAIWYAAPPR